MISYNHFTSFHYAAFVELLKFMKLYFVSTRIWRMRQNPIQDSATCSFLLLNN